MSPHHPDRSVRRSGAQRGGRGTGNAASRRAERTDSAAMPATPPESELPASRSTSSSACSELFATPPGPRCLRQSVEARAAAGQPRVDKERSARGAHLIVTAPAVAPAPRRLWSPTARPIVVGHAPPSLALILRQATASGLTGNSARPTLAALCCWPCSMPSSAC